MEKTRHDSAVTIGLHSLFKTYNLPPNRPVKLYRHSDHKHRAAYLYPSYSDVTVFNVEKVYQDGMIIPFQGAQSSKNLGYDLVAFFIGEADGASRFIGHYEISAIGNYNYKSENAQKARDLNFISATDVWHELVYQPQYQPLENRLIAEWPKQRTSHHWLVKENGDINDIAVTEIRATGSFTNFPGFNKLILQFTDLEKHLHHQTTSHWVKILRQTRGVYLITDTKNGLLYVGSATGENGMWGRWSEYAKSKHGGNKLMINALNEKTIDAQNFQISVLETLSNRATKQDGLDAERRWKTMLGKKATILNGN